MVASVLMSAKIHDKWKAVYRTAENSDFYDLACQGIAEYFYKIDGPVLDAGCGTGEKTSRLMELGYDVIGVDITPVVLNEARAKLQAINHNDRAKLVQADLTNLAFPDAAFAGILVWGVLLHVPQLEKVVAELCRVLKPGGKILVYDANPRSIDAKLLTLLRTITGRERTLTTKLGIENWFESREGSLLVRWTYSGALRELFHMNGVTFDRQRAGQFTELYVYVRNALLRSLIHRWNNSYFKYIRWHVPSYATMRFGKKTYCKTTMSKG